MATKLAANRLYMVIGYNAWGRGRTIAEALKNWKKNAYAKKTVEVCLYDVPDRAYVNEMGGMVCPKGTAPGVLVEKRTVEV